MANALAALEFHCFTEIRCAVAHHVNLPSVSNHLMANKSLRA